MCEHYLYLKLPASDSSCGDLDDELFHDSSAKFKLASNDALAFGVRAAETVFVGEVYSKLVLLRIEGGSNNLHGDVFEGNGELKEH